LLSLRAQILLCRGDSLRARAVADYLLQAEGGPTHRIEETPLGPVLTPEVDPRRSWARYLISRIVANEPATLSLPPTELMPDQVPPDLPNPFAPPDRPDFLRERGAAVPFAPFDPRVDLPVDALRNRPAVPGDRPPAPPQPVLPSRRPRQAPSRTDASGGPTANHKRSG
jgi:hypothetical protein